MKNILKVSTLASLSFLFLLGCGSDSSDAPLTNGNDVPTYTAGVYEDESNFKNLCQSPRNFNDINGDPYPDRQGSTLHENHWLRSWSNRTYLWYDELPDLNPGNYSDPIAFFDLLKTDAVTQSGNPKDNFHFTIDTSDYEQSTQAGISVGYGIDWLLTSSTPPRELYIRFIEPNSPADAPALNLTRGVQVLEIDGVSVETGSSQSEVDTLNAGLFPSSDGESHTFTVLDIGSNQSRQVTLSATEVTSDPVPIVDTFSTNNGTVGYIHFNDHNFVSEDELFNAVTTLSNQNVDDLILDLRYNGGGYLYIASQLSYMIAGANATSGRTFEQIRFNDKYPNTNPITGSTLQPTPFYNVTSQYSSERAEGVSLPQLNLSRVFILSTSRTCSASEAIINGLRGIDVEVILIGDTTCGKPYGFYATDNCGTTYFTIQFDGVNDKGSGGYSDGFSPMNTSGTVGELVTGCSVEDNLDFALGNSQEPMVAAALSYRETGSCPTVAQSQKSFVPSFTKQHNKGASLKVERDFNQKIYLDPFKD